MKTSVLALLTLLSACSSNGYISSKPSFRYVAPKLDKMNEVEILTINEKKWTTKYLSDETQAGRFTDDSIDRMLKIQNKRKKWDVLKRKFFYTFKNKNAGKIGIYQTAAEGESLRLISFKLYMDHIRAYDIQKLNPTIKKIDESLSRKMLIYYEIPEFSNVFQARGIPIRAQKGEGLVGVNYRVTKDIVKWVELFKFNTIYIKSPHDIKRGDILYYNADWNFSSDPAQRTSIPEVIYSSSDVEYHFLMKANMFSSQGSLAGIAKEEFEEFK
jgi:hypothetical protein